MQNSDNMANSLPDLRGSMGEHLGIKFITMEEGKVVATMPVDHRTCQPFGLLNGGASLALAEMVAGHGSVPLCSNAVRHSGKRQPRGNGASGRRSIRNSHRHNSAPWQDNTHLEHRHNEPDRKTHFHSKSC